MQSYLFSYGTLQHPEIQLKILGRKIRGKREILDNYRALLLTEVTGASLSDNNYTIATFTGDSTDCIQGTALPLTEEDLKQTDTYEGSLYRRFKVTMRSGRQAWVYGHLSREHVIEKTSEFVKTSLTDGEGGHDWWHTLRVRKWSMRLAKNENVNLLVIELGALLHDIADSKFHDGDESIGPQKARAFLGSMHLDESVINHVEQIVANISFKRGNNRQYFSSKELDIVQDADRLDAIGAIGIARAFNYGGYKNNPIYDPEIPPKLHMTPQEYKRGSAPTINHFYEKLLLLKDRMNTDAGKKLAMDRHQFLKTYLEKFHKEWEGESE